MTHPCFKFPGLIDLLLGTDLFGTILQHAQWVGPPGIPSTTQTAFVWVLASNLKLELSSTDQITAFCAFALQHDDLMRKFHEVVKVEDSKET